MECEYKMATVVLKGAGLNGRRKDKRRSFGSVSWADWCKSRVLWLARCISLRPSCACDKASQDCWFFHIWSSACHAVFTMLVASPACVLSVCLQFICHSNPEPHATGPLVCGLTPVVPPHWGHQRCSHALLLNWNTPALALAIFCFWAS